MKAAGRERIWSLTVTATLKRAGIDNCRNIADYTFMTPSGREAVALLDCREKSALRTLKRPDKLPLRDVWDGILKELPRVSEGRL